MVNEVEKYKARKRNEITDFFMLIKYGFLFVIGIVLIGYNSILFFAFNNYLNGNWALGSGATIIYLAVLTLIWGVYFLRRCNENEKRKND